MNKPLLRFTIGPCLQQGLDILAESMRRTTKALGVDKWDWVVCHNGLNKSELEFLRTAAGDVPFLFVPQNWSTCPIDDRCQSPKRNDGSFEWNGNHCGGTMWKVCPPRLRMETHELVIDNDIIILKPFEQIAEWLQSDKVLLLEEPIRFYGRYDHLFPEGKTGPFLNSGLMGLPPGYDFGKEIEATWSRNGRWTGISQADEQGLLTHTLSQQPSIRIRQDQMIEVLHRDYKTKISLNTQAYHFTQANRIPKHNAWEKFQSLGKNDTLI